MNSSTILIYDKEISRLAAVGMTAPARPARMSVPEAATSLADLNYLSSPPTRCPPAIPASLYVRDQYDADTQTSNPRIKLPGSSADQLEESATSSELASSTRVSSASVQPKSSQSGTSLDSKAPHSGDLPSIFTSAKNVEPDFCEYFDSTDRVQRLHGRWVDFRDLNFTLPAPEPWRTFKAKQLKDFDARN